MAGVPVQVWLWGGELTDCQEATPSATHVYSQTPRSRATQTLGFQRVQEEKGPW